ncbi:MAG: hypothetical protein GQ571_09905 [Desulfobacterales bacterium]|nr:hypothetical protein [Desulfobacterales bacterium]
MKIYGNDEILKNGYLEKTPKNERTTDADFKNILKESVENSTKNPPEIQPTTLLDPVSAIRFNPLSTQDKNITVERVENLLNLLENYRQQLENPNVTLRTLEPVMNTIAKEKDQLSAVLDSMPNEDRLKDILNQTLITASLEVIKFNRGDYITS